jgi:chemotaxis protein MotA
MDIATLLGIAIGGMAILVSMMMVAPITAFIDPPSVMITGGGTMAALLINYPLGDILKVLKIVPVTFQAKHFDPVPIVNKLLELKEAGQRKGLATLETMAADIPDPFMKRGVEMVSNNMPDDQIRYALETEMEFTEYRHGLGESIFNSMAALAPAYGLIGTLIGLIAMLRGLGGGEAAVEAIGKGMAVALITSLYGALMANFVALPLAGKLKVVHEEEYAHKRLIAEGMIMLSQGIRENMPPRQLGERLGMYLPSSMREQIQVDQSTAA